MRQKHTVQFLVGAGVGEESLFSSSTPPQFFFAVQKLNTHEFRKLKY